MKSNHSGSMEMGMKKPVEAKEQDKYILPDLHFYGYRDKRGVWFGVCLDFAIVATAYSPEELRRVLNEMIESYLDVVMDPKDLRDIRSLQYLLTRTAPAHDWMKYYAIKALSRFLGRFSPARYKVWG